MAILAGANGPTAIVRWASAKTAFLCQELPLPHGVPCKDVFRNVLSLLKPKVFHACFTTWLDSLKLKAMEKHHIDRPILSIDGKTLRRSHDKANGLGALHSVSVWASELGLSLGQTGCEEKSNEITAIPQLLQLVDIAGSVVTIDAMGCQKAIAKLIVEGEADYVLALKGNQGKLHDAVTEHIIEQMENDYAGIDAQHYTITEKVHGREETRIYTHLPVPEGLPMLDEWEGLKSVGVATRLYRKDGQECADVRYFISSLAVGVELFARAVRQHWGIENGCHWVLDVAFREDLSRVREGNAATTFAIVRRMALAMLKKVEGAKGGVGTRRLTAGWDTTFLERVLQVEPHPN